MGRPGPLRIRCIGAAVLVPCEPADHDHGTRGTHGGTPGGQPLVSDPVLGRAPRGDPSSSVVDPFGHVWDVPDLFVFDASVLPSSCHVNPQITIMALVAPMAAR